MIARLKIDGPTCNSTVITHVFFRITNLAGNRAEAVASWPLRVVWVEGFADNNGYVLEGLSKDCADNEKRKSNKLQISPARHCFKRARLADLNRRLNLARGVPAGSRVLATSTSGNISAIEAVESVTAGLSRQLRQCLCLCAPRRLPRKAANRSVSMTRQITAMRSSNRTAQIPVRGVQPFHRVASANTTSTAQLSRTTAPPSLPE